MVHDHTHVYVEIPKTGGNTDTVQSGGQTCATFDRRCAAQAWEDKARSQDTAADDGKGEPKQDAAPDGRKMVLDWKGDPMYINPGDKLPF